MTTSALRRASAAGFGAGLLAVSAAPAFAQATKIEPADTAWMIAATALVLTMTIPGADQTAGEPVKAGIKEGTEQEIKEEAMKKINSPNHEGDGQNILYADGHVEFQQHPFCGMDRDNIYTYGKSGETSGGDGIIGSPTNEKDSILLPTAKQTAAKK